MNIPIVAQGDVVRSGTEILAYRTIGTYTQAQVDADAYVLDIRKDPAAPSTWNRYAVVTQNQEPTAPDFLNATARTKRVDSGTDPEILDGAMIVGLTCTLPCPLPKTRRPSPGRSAGST